MNELERLIAEQEADDTDFVRPELQAVSLEAVGEYIGGNDTYFSGTEDEHYSFGDEDNGIYSFLEPQKGDVLVGGASWHGTFHGYTRRRCRCKPCTEANKIHQREVRKKRRSASAADAA